MTKKIKMKINRIVVFLFILFCFNSCNSQTKKRGSWENKNFETYLTNKNIAFKKQENGYLYTESNKSLYDQYYSDFMKYETKVNLESSPYLKVNKVYVHYRTPTSVEFTVYSDEETFCLSTFDLDIDGKILSFPENGIVKVLEPIIVENFGDFEITGNIIKTRKRHKTPSREWYEYVNGIIKNDTIHFTEKFVGTDSYQFKKNWLAKAKKTDVTEIYQPNLKAKKYVNGFGLVTYEVTGEFQMEYAKQTF